MPIYMDVHIVPGVTSKAVAEAHNLDVAIQDEHDCKCMTYWIDEVRESVFCLIEAPNREAVKDMHDKAHGLIPHKIIEVNSSLVESFLGRIYDPSDGAKTETGLPLITDSPYRILVVTRTTDPVLLRHQLGDAAQSLLQAHNAVIRRNLAQFGGREVEHSGSGFLLSFSSATAAVNCALAIHNDMPKADADQLGFRMSITSGTPVTENEELFGDTIQMAQQLCFIPRPFQVTVASSVKELIARDGLHQQNQVMALSATDEALLRSLFRILEERWQDADFDVDDYGRAMAMSKSQLYRKCLALTGLAPNVLIKEYRLEKAKELMRGQQYNIAQITFDSGFTSPSYFTKCFKKRYGILPGSYLELLQ